MPTNKELIEDILKIQPDVNTNDLNKTQLTALLSDLQAAHALSAGPAPYAGATEEEKNLPITYQDGFSVQQGAPELEDKEGVTTPQTPDADADTEDEPTPQKVHTVVEGKAITTRRGLLKSGREITAEDLTGGQESLDILISKGYIK